MSIKQTLDKLAALSSDLLGHVTKAFPDAASIVDSAAYDLTGKTARAKEAILAASDEVSEAMEEVATAVAASIESLPWPFPMSADFAKKPADEFQLFRHVRDGFINDAGQSVVAPAGGVSFYIDVKHQPEPELQFAICVQEAGKNFQYRLGRNVAKGRFEHGQHISGPYDLSKSLLQNIQDTLTAVVFLGNKIPSVKTQLAEAKIDFTMLCMAANMMAEYATSLPRQNPGDPK